LHRFDHEQLLALAHHVTDLHKHALDSFGHGREKDGREIELRFGYHVLHVALRVLWQHAHLNVGSSIHDGDLSGFLAENLCCHWL
ncbi:hypothetical protein PENTCL1PPCAC_24952, partial [Pristionchus entomophagus]